MCSWDAVGIIFIVQGYIITNEINPMDTIINHPKPCENPPKDFPLNDECKPCPTVVPADECPIKQSENFRSWT